MYTMWPKDSHVLHQVARQRFAYNEKKAKKLIRRVGLGPERHAADRLHAHLARS